VNFCLPSFCSVASFGFGGQESASKPPQAICKPLAGNLTGRLGGNEKINMIKQFWDWFTNQQLTLRKITDGDYDLIDIILIELRKIQTGLAVEFEKNGDEIIMTISADGIEDNFEVVKDIVNNAPKIEQWGFVAFRQPVPREKINSISIKVKEVTLDPKNIWFRALNEDDKLYIQIFSDNLTEDNKGDISYGCFMLLDNLIGEYDCVKRVSAYEFYNTNEAQEFKEDLNPLTEIPDFLNYYYGVD
jgi:hypothetical protein